MELQNLPETLILRDGFVAMGAWLAAMLAMLAVSLHILLRPEAYRTLAPSPFWARVIGGGSSVLFAAGLVAATISFAPSRNGLELTREGFSDRRAFGVRTRYWRDIREIRAVPRGNPEDDWLAWFYVPMVVEYRLPPPPGSPSTCCIETLHDHYGMTASELAALMERWRRRATSGLKRQ